MMIHSTIFSRQTLRKMHKIIKVQRISGYHRPHLFYQSMKDKGNTLTRKKGNAKTFFSYKGIFSTNAWQWNRLQSLINKSRSRSWTEKEMSSSSSSKWFVIVVISIALVAIALQRRSSAPTSTLNRERLFTLNELRTFTNEELYLAILGKHGQ